MGAVKQRNESRLWRIVWLGYSPMNTFVDMILAAVGDAGGGIAGAGGSAERARPESRGLKFWLLSSATHQILSYWLSGDEPRQSFQFGWFLVAIGRLVELFMTSSPSITPRPLSPGASAPMEGRFRCWPATSGAGRFSESPQLQTAWNRRGEGSPAGSDSDATWSGRELAPCFVGSA